MVHQKAQGAFVSHSPIDTRAEKGRFCVDAACVCVAVVSSKTLVDVGTVCTRTVVTHVARAREAAVGIRASCVGIARVGSSSTALVDVHTHAIHTEIATLTCALERPWRLHAVRRASARVRVEQTFGHIDARRRDATITRRALPSSRALAVVAADRIKACLGRGIARRSTSHAHRALVNVDTLSSTGQSIPS